MPGLPPCALIRAGEGGGGKGSFRERVAGWLFLYLYAHIRRRAELYHTEGDSWAAGARVEGSVEKANTRGNARAERELG